MWSWQKSCELEYFAEYFTKRFMNINISLNISVQNLRENEEAFATTNSSHTDAGQRLYAHIDETPLLDVLPFKEILWIPCMFHQHHINLSAKYSAKYSGSQIFCQLGTNILANNSANYLLMKVLPTGKSFANFMALTAVWHSCHIAVNTASEAEGQNNTSCQMLLLIWLSTLRPVANDLLNDAFQLDNELSALAATCSLRSVSKVQINHLGLQNPL